MSPLRPTGRLLCRPQTAPRPAVMGLVSFPPVPPGEDPYATYLRSLDETFNPALNAGFVPRLAVLWALTG